MSESTEIEPLSVLIDDFVQRANAELQSRWKKWPLDLAKNEVHEVVGALIARQVTLACRLALSPLVWNGSIAPILLRAMADVYISVAWVLLQPVDRARKFIHYGLGQEKLALEHRRAQILVRGAKEGEEEMIAAREAWINSQRATFLTEVNLGSWAGISIRDMAQEADCLDFYNYVYAPFSGCAHSMWHHVALYNLKECSNPLHRLHSIPMVPDEDIQPHYLYLAGKYLQKAFSVLDKAMGTSIDGKSAFERLCEDLKVLDDPTVLGGGPESGTQI